MKSRRHSTKIWGSPALFSYCPPLDPIELQRLVGSNEKFCRTPGRTGKGPEELEGWASELEDRADSLATQCQELEPMARTLWTLSAEHKKVKTVNR